MKDVKIFFFVLILSFLLFPFTSHALTFTLSDDAIMALDYNNQDSYYNCGPDAHIIAITDIPGPGVQYNILFSDPYSNGPWWPALEWISSVRDGNGILAGRDVTMFDAFALKFTFLSAGGVSLADTPGFVTVGAYLDWAYHPEDIAINLLNSPVNPPLSAVSSTSLMGLPAEKIYKVGFTCYIPFWYYDDDISSAPWDPNGAIVSILVEPAPDAVVMNCDPNQLFQLISVNKCKVVDGKKPGTDKISLSGKMNPAYGDINEANFIRLTIDSNYINLPKVITLPISNRDYIKTGKFSYSGTDSNDIKSSFKLDLNTHKFSLSARNLDLSGLSCPINVRINTSNFDANICVDETIANGKKPVPINLLTGIKNSIRVDNLKLKQGDTGSFTVKGGFSVYDADVNIASEALFVKFGLPYTIPAYNIKVNKSNTKFTFSKVKLYDGLNLVGIASGYFDLKKCTFFINMKNIGSYPGYNELFILGFKDFNEEVELQNHYVRENLFYYF